MHYILYSTEILVSAIENYKIHLWNIFEYTGIAVQAHDNYQIESILLSSFYNLLCSEFSNVTKFGQKF